MKKVILILIVAALGISGGVYLASKTDMTQNQAQVQEQTWNVTHPRWKGKLILESPNRVYLNINGDYATIISNENGVLAVKWDNWGTESFACDTQNNCTLVR